MARKDLETIAGALGAEGPEEPQPTFNAEDPHDRAVHAISVHAHSDGKGFTVHHHHQPVTHPDHHHVGHISSHVAEGEEDLADHMREHAPKLHMAHHGSGMAMSGEKVDTG